MPLEREFHRAIRAWVWLGLLAFLGVLIMFGLMLRGPAE